MTSNPDAFVPSQQTCRRRYQAIDAIRAGYRRCIFGAHTIYYRTDENSVHIMRILGREKPDLLDT
ncbi:type II toxin-antitoxin system RelE/ParE family toxin [Thalassospira sp.]|uniref:type II toxin-antitoxin system RelE/ParE family toxin n=1 Tax=Thalassospira sp. TaxID=1912094 RepID=UPI0032EB0878